MTLKPQNLIQAAEADLRRRLRNIEEVETMSAEILEAIEIAAGAGDEAVGSASMGRRVTSSPRRITGAREVIKRFCELLPSDTTVADILEVLHG